jgi:hypothetical protein
MIEKLLLLFLIVIFFVGSIGIVLIQLNIFWQRYCSFARKKQQNKTVIKERSLSLKVVEREEMSERHFSVRLQSVNGEPLDSFLPGQYLTLMVPSQPAQGFLSSGIQKRCYSLASWQKTADSYELGIQQEADGQVSTWLHRYLQVGTVINTLPPNGNFVIEAKQSFHIVLVAGGIGITPLRAMVHQFIFQFASDLSSNKSMSLFYSAKSVEEMCYLDEFIQLADEFSSFKFYPMLSKAAQHWQGTTGRLSAERLVQTLNSHIEILQQEINGFQSKIDSIKDMATYHYYVCGPNGMMDDIKSGLIRHGIPVANIHFERFGVGNSPLADETFSVELGKNKTIIFQKQRTLLDAMEKQGVEIQSECRSGECGQCKVKLHSGKIKQLVETDMYLNVGEILPCCCVPESDLLIEV